MEIAARRLAAAARSCGPATADRRDRRVQAGRAGGAADPGDAGARAARAEAAAALAEPAPRARARLRQGARADGCSSRASSCDGQTLDHLVAAAGRCRWIARRRSSRRSARRCSKGRRSAWFTTICRRRTCSSPATTRSRSSTSWRRSPVTETVFGVPEYLSPEQAEGKLVDQRSNTYSLGGILMSAADRTAAGVGRRRRGACWSR